MTRIIEWIEERFERGAWVRRFYLFGAFFLNWQTLMWAQRFAESNATKDGLQIAAIVAAIAAIPGGVLAHAFSVYTKSRGE